MDRTETLEKVIDVVRETLDLDDSVALTEGPSFKALGADSFDLLQLVTDLEQEFDMTFDAENIDEIATVGDAVDAILAA